MNVLIVTDEPPYPGFAVNPVRYFHLVRYLSREHRVTLLCLSRSAKDRSAVSEMEKYGCNVIVVPAGTSKVRHLFHCLGALMRGEPIQVGYHACMSARKRIRELCREQRFDIVHIEHAHMAPYLSAIEKPWRFKSVLYLHNVGPVMFNRIRDVEDRFLRKLEYRLNAWFSSRWEPRVCRRFDRCIVFSEEDRKEYLSFAEDVDPSVISMGVDVAGIPCLPPPTHAGEMLFIGTMSYPPNRDAIHYFCRDILPLIQEKRKGTNLHIVGRPALQEFERYAPGAALNITGWVEDPQVFYRRSAVSVVPIRAGSGVRSKILESMALGRPVVSTSMGCEGLKVTHGENILIADTPEDFAEGALRLMSDSDLWKRLVENGRRFVAENHDYRKVSEDLLGLYRELTSMEAR